uniref:G-protein coupled receptors family 1 profile domain-containing protein n=1 Tax=Periophthalmus magnuspinnatus TaxID=409849 RepID=A0A3B3ZRX8_9GOBI
VCYFWQLHSFLLNATSDCPNLSAPWDPSAPRHAALSRTGHTAVAVVLGFIFVLGFLGNFVALLVFSRYPVLRTPVNLLLINISASDMLVCIFGTPMSFAASVRGRWLTGSYGCRWYGFSNALFGIVSLISLSLLSFERYSAVVHSVPSDSSQFGRARFAVAASWLYSLAWTLPPLLGWSSYGPEGPGTTCSVQWDRQSPTARSYVSCLFTFCLLLPLLLMLFCYGRIIMAVRTVPRLSQSAAERREGRVLLMVVSMVTSYLVCWLPYGVVAMLFSFGRPGAVPPVASLVPSLLAKTSTVLNPVIYVLLNKQVPDNQIKHVQVLCGLSMITPVHMKQSEGKYVLYALVTYVLFILKFKICHNCKRQIVI